MKLKKNLFALASLAALQGLALAGPLYKLNNTVDLNQVGSWTTVSGLTSNPGSILGTDPVYFNEVNMQGDKTLALGVGGLTIGGMAVDYATADTANNVVISAGGTLTLNGASLGNSGVPAASYTAAGIVLNRGAGGALTINADVALGAAQSWVSGRSGTNGFTVNGAVALGTNNLTLNVAAGVSTISGDISGTGKVMKIGAGTLQLPNASTASTSFQLGPDAGSANVGIVIVGNASSLGTAAIVSRGTQLRSSTPGLVITNPVSVGAGGLRLGGTNDFTLSGITTLDTTRSISNYGTNTVTLGGIATVTGNSANFDAATGRIIVSGAITGLGGVSVSTGNVVLNGVSTYSGTTLVSGGRISGTGTIPTAVTMSGGTIGLIGGATTGSALTFAAGAAFTGNPLVAFDTAPLVSTTYDVFNYTGSVTTLANLKSTVRGTFANAGTKVTFTTGAANLTRTWNTTNGTWDGTGVNATWLEDDFKFYNGDSAIFAEPAAASAVAVSGTVTATGFAVSNTTNAYTFTGGVITGTTGLTKTGAGAMTLSLGHTYTGNVLVSAGWLTGIGGTVSASTGSSFGLKSNTRTITVQNTGTIWLTGTAGSSNTFGGGGMTVSQIPTIIAKDGGVIRTGKFNTVGNVILQNGGALTNSSTETNASYGGFQFIGSITVSGTGAGTLMNLNGSARPNHLNGTGNTTFDVADLTASSAPDLTVSAPLANGSGDYMGTGSLVKTGNGTMLLSAANSYSGSTTVSEGALEVSGNLGAGSLSIASGSTLKLSAAGTLNGGDHVAGISNAGTIDIANTVAQKISGVITGTGPLIKSGSGVLTLSAGNDYSGPTSITGGTLAVTGSLSEFSAVTVGSGATLSGTGYVNGGVTVSDGGKLAAGTAAGLDLIMSSLTIANTATINIAELQNYNALTVTNAPLTSQGFFLISGPSGSITVNLPAAPIAAGTYHIIGSPNTLANTAKFVLGTKPALGSRQTGTLVANAGFIDYQVTGVNPVWTGTFDGEWSTAAKGTPKNWFTTASTDFITGDIVTFNDTATAFTVTIPADVTPTSVFIDNSANDYTFTGAAGIAGASTTVTKNGVSSATFNTANSYGGGTTIIGGTLIMGNASAIGAGPVTLGAATLNVGAYTLANNIVTTGGTLAGTTFQLDGVLSGTSLAINASGIVKLTGVNTYTGATTVNSGGLEISGSGQLNSGNYAGAITNPAILRFSTSANQTLSGVISGAGVLEKNNSNTLTITAAPTYAGSTTVNGGTLVIATPTSVKLGTNLINVNPAAVLRLDGTNVLYAGTIYTSIVVDGGTVSLNAEHNHFGPLTLINGATVRGIRIGTSYNNEYSTFDADVIVGGNATNTIAGDSATLGYNLNAAARGFTVDPTGDPSGVDLLVSGRLFGGANIGLAKNGTGVMKLTGANIYNGNTVINNGVLDLSTTGQLYTGGYRTSTVSVNTGGTLKIKNIAYNETAGSVASLGGLSDYGTSRVINGGTFEILGGSQSAGNNFNVTVEGGTLRYAPAVTTDTLELKGNLNSNIALAGALTLDAVGNVLISEIITGAGSITKTGNQTLTLSGVNTYTGDTTVNAGVLAVGGSAIVNTGKLVINSGGKVAPSAPETVNELFFGTVQQAAGTWGATGSGAAHLDDTHFSGTSVVNVTTGPAVTGYGSWAALNAPAPQTAAQDYDGDGVANAIEYVIGGSATTNDNGKLPAITTPGGNMIFTFVRAQSSKTADTAVAIEVGTSLSGWTSTYTVGDNTAGSTLGVEVNDNGNGTDTVTLTVAKGGDAKKFARLTVKIN